MTLWTYTTLTDSAAGEGGLLRVWCRTISQVPGRPGVERAVQPSAGAEVDHCGGPSFVDQEVRPEQVEWIQLGRPSQTGIDEPRTRTFRRDASTAESIDLASAISHRPR